MTTTSASAMVNEHGKVLAVKKIELNTKALSLSLIHISEPTRPY